MTNCIIGIVWQPQALKLEIPALMPVQFSKAESWRKARTLGQRMRLLHLPLLSQSGWFLLFQGCEKKRYYHTFKWLFVFVSVMQRANCGYYLTTISPQAITADTHWHQSCDMLIYWLGKTFTFCSSSVLSGFDYRYFQLKDLFQCSQPRCPSAAACDTEPNDSLTTGHEDNLSTPVCKKLWIGTSMSNVCRNVWSSIILQSFYGVDWTKVVWLTKTIKTLNLSRKEFIYKSEVFLWTWADLSSDSLQQSSAQHSRGFHDV